MVSPLEWDRGASPHRARDGKLPKRRWTTDTLGRAPWHEKQFESMIQINQTDTTR